MAQAFVSLYNQDYFWKKPKFTPKYDPQSVDVYYCFDEKTSGGESKQLEYNEALAKQEVKQLHKKRLISTYTRHYYPKKLTSITQKSEQSDNELLKHLKAVYSSKKTSDQPPLPTTRKLFGYMPPSRLQTPFSKYQSDVGRIGYEILLKQNEAESASTIENPSEPQTKSSLKDEVHTTKKPKIRFYIK